MSNREFSQAPVSEVVIGVTFTERVMSLREIFGFSKVFEKRFPIIEVKNPLANQKLEGFKHITEINNESVSPFRVFQRTDDTSYLIQYQANKLFFNWIRRDEENVGIYPGFNQIKEEFDNVLTAFLEYLNKESLEVEYYDLTYQDRILWGEHISSLSDIATVLNLNPPSIVLEGLNNITSEYTYNLPEINGYGLLELSTVTSLNDEQLLRFQNTARGSDSFQNLNNWFEKAHDLQISKFKEFFTNEVLEKWK